VLNALLRPINKRREHLQLNFSLRGPPALSSAAPQFKNERRAGEHRAVASFSLLRPTAPELQHQIAKMNH
jgi:hypothetical protein